MSEAIFKVVDQLPSGGITVMSLKALDFVIPGQWQNIVGFDNTIRHVTGETDPALVRQIGERAVRLFNDRSQGYQRALWLYQTVDNTDALLGAAALANKVGEKISFLGFLDKITPKPERAQAIDLSIKLIVEILAFCQINGIPGDSLSDFLRALGDYGGESLMRMAALICFDGLIPLGPDFLLKCLNTLHSLQPNDLQENPTFKAISSVVPGGSPAGQLGFILQSVGAVQGWMSQFVASRDLTPEKVVNSLQNFIELSKDNLDYLGAFLDMTTNYYYHTGVQTLARRLIERAVAEI
ncbi:hypothetical protein L5470_03920 [Synechococcus sp. PCC 6717]|uniref:Uncharacterized protein n=1 Tax=Parathermosynechococcus lividus PCC 6715 TaxID=1917166 RepID=A0A2D2PZ07_PARLV|nr:hypothetical protein [Thermostichus lividus]ATS17473.1 hypothetical protein BRW62_00480 [Thermostichus lividus PCC 6715]MCI3280135.1 hypothetical protein [Synechococcus sp. PCC 6717]